jgi:prepilin-type N-terminal cleavage/methylation domain-containing protein/prepilin-type processing-associated H-X9-DG protein
MKKTAFTLVELLVVVAIIALLVAMMVPGLSKARALGRMAICQSNLHQIHNGFRAACAQAKTSDSAAWPANAYYSSAELFPDVPMNVEGNKDVFVCPDEPQLAGFSFLDQLSYSAGGGTVSLSAPDNNWFISREGADDKGPFRDFIFEDDGGASNGAVSFNGYVDIDGACRIWQDGTILLFSTVPPEWGPNCSPKSGLNTCGDVNVLQFNGKPIFGTGQMRPAGSTAKVDGAGLTNYGMNSVACTSPANDTVVVTDYKATIINPDASVTPQKLLDSARHLGKLNVLLSDGSVARRTPLELSPVVDMRQWKGK